MKKMTVEQILDTYEAAVTADGDYTTVLFEDWESAEEFSADWEDSRTSDIGHFFSLIGPEPQYNRALLYQTETGENIEVVED